MNNEHNVPNNKTNKQPHTTKTMQGSMRDHSSTTDTNLGVDPSDAKAAPMARRRAKPIVIAILLLAPLVGAAVWFGIPRTQPTIMAMAQNGRAELETGFIKIQTLIAGPVRQPRNLYPFAASA